LHTLRRETGEKQASCLAFIVDKEGERWLSEYLRSNPNDSRVRDLLREARSKQKK